MLLRACAASVALAACGGSPAACELASDTGPAPAALIYRTVGGDLVDVIDGGDLPLVPAPQGGVIVLVGARVQGIGACEVTVNAAVRDPGSNRVIGLEERPITLADRGDGWSVPAEPIALASYANVAVCPSSVIAGTLDGYPVHLEVRISATADQAPIELAADLTPRCDAGDALCTCQCDPACGGVRAD